MKLPIPFLNTKRGKSEYYLALLLNDEKASAVILQEDSGKVKIIGKHEEHLPSPIETLPQDELITLIDKTISRAEEVLPPDIETHKTVFGVKEDWVEKETKKIKKEHLAKLKKVCDALDMTPIGFMVITEAIANLLQFEEGSPLSAILVEVGKKTVSLVLFRGGQIAETVSGPLYDSVPVAVDSLLKNFTASVLPTRIILFHAKDAKNLAQHFIHHQWSKNLPFLHVPQISVLPQDFDLRAVTYGASQQMGFEVLDLPAKPEAFETQNQKQEQEIKNVENKEIALPDILPTDNFGFVQEQDIAKQVQTPPVKPLSENAAVVGAEPGEFKEMDNSLESSHVDLGQTKSAELIAENEVSKEFPESEKKSVLANIFSVIPVISVPKIPKLPSSMTKNKKLILPLIILFAILIIGVVLSIFYFYSVHANVILSVKPKKVTQDTSITFSATAGSDFSKNVIAAQSVSTNIDGDLSTAATGKKDTGDKAKGSVTIFNSSSSNQSLSSGTAIKSNNGLTFTLDKDVDIASASGDIFSGTKPGTTKVNVTAKDLGTESNLPSNTQFSIGGNSTLAGKNESAFSGGSKKTITVVGKDDLAKLKADLPKSLEKKAQDALSKKIENGQTVLPGFVSSTLSDAKFDKSIDDEAKQVKLNATVNFVSMGYKNTDLEDYDKSILKDHYSQDISFSDKDLKNDLKNVKVKNDKEIQALLTITAGLLPKIDSGDVVNKLKGKSAKQVQELLGTLPQVVSSEIKFSPNILFLSSLFPSLPKNIQVTVKSE